MAVSLLENHPARASAARASLVGFALAVVAYSGAGLILYDAGGLLVGTTGLVATLLFALGVGIWAGAPTSRGERRPAAGRWMVAGIATALAGTFSTYSTLYGEVGGGVLAPMVSLLVLVAAPVYALGLLLPMLVESADHARDELDGDGDDDDAPRSGLGSICAGFIAGAVIGVLLAGLVFIPSLAPGPILLGVAIALLIPSLIREQRIASNEEVLFEAGTPHGVLTVVEVTFPGERQPERRLYLNGEQESGETVRSGAPTLAYVSAAEALLAHCTGGGASYLFLGGGAYTLPRRVAERDPDAEITVVELDPEVTRLAYRYFGLREEHGITSVHGDARAFLSDAAAGAYDRIYLDVYGGTEALPHSLLTVEALRRTSDHIRPGGFVAMNLIGALAGDEAPRLWSVVTTLREVFASVTLYLHFGHDFPDRQNVLVVASDDVDLRLPERAGLFEVFSDDPQDKYTGAVVLRDISGTLRPRDPSSSAPSA